MKAIAKMKVPDEFIDMSDREMESTASGVEDVVPANWKYRGVSSQRLVLEKETFFSKTYSGFKIHEFEIMKDLPNVEVKENGTFTEFYAGNLEKAVQKAGIITGLAALSYGIYRACSD